MADKHINIKLGTKYDGGGISSALRSLKKFVHGATDIKSAFSMVAGVVNRAFSGVKTIVGSAFRFETQTTQFKTLIGNIDEAKAHMADLKALGDTPPFDLAQFAAASRSLMVMTDGVLGYKKSLEMIGDAAAATGMPIESMSHAIGRLYAFIRDGQPLSRAVMQLRNMGVITPEVAQKLQDLQAAGKSNAEIWAEVEAQLGRYKGAMSETEKTGEGLMGAIKSRWDNIVRAFGLAFADTAKEGMGAVLDKAKQLEEDGTLEVWATKVGEACRSVAEAARVAFGWIGKLVDGYNWIRDQAEQGGAYIGGVIGTKMAGGSWDEAWKNGEKAMRDTEREQKDRDLDYEKIRANAVKKVAERKAKEEREAAKRAADEEKRIQESLAAGQKKTDERNAKAAAEKRAEAEKKAAQDAAKERERLERELHQQRMADIRAEIKAQEEAASSLQATATAAQSEFERAFAMYRDPERAAAEIEEERSRAADLNRLHKDASRYGGKWRIDELSALMAAGDSQGVSDALAGWRKSRSFTPEVEAMVRASAAEKTKTTAEDELRKLNDQTADLTQKMEDLAKERDTRLDGIEHNTNQLANKIDELLSVKG